MVCNLLKFNRSFVALVRREKSAPASVRAQESRSRGQIVRRHVAQRFHSLRGIIAIQIHRGSNDRKIVLVEQRPGGPRFRQIGRHRFRASGVACSSQHVSDLHFDVQRRILRDRCRRIFLGCRRVFHLRFNKCLVRQHRRRGFFAARRCEAGAGALKQFLGFFQTPNVSLGISAEPNR